MKSFKCPPDMSGAGCEWSTVNESGHMLHNCKASKCVGLHVLWLVPLIFLLKSKVPIIYYTGFIDPGTGRHISSDLWCLLSLAETIMGPFVFVAATSLFIKFFNRN